MKELSENEKSAEVEAKIVVEKLEAEREKIQGKYKDVQGLDVGAKEDKEVVKKAMAEIVEIRKKYHIPKPKNN